jgi:hypothetical protein
MIHDDSKEITLQELWRLLSDEGDITITVDIVKTDYIRKGLAKQKHREMVKLGEFADKTLQFKSNPLKQNEEEKEAGVVRIRLQLIQQEGLTLHGVQVNAINEFED